MLIVDCCELRDACWLVCCRFVARRGLLRVVCGLWLLRVRGSSSVARCMSGVVCVCYLLVGFAVCCYVFVMR